MRISDWSSDVCSSDLAAGGADLARARSIFAQAVEVAVEGQDQRAGFRDLEVVGRDLHPLPLQLRHLVAEVPGVQHDAVADHRQRAAHDAGGEQRELVDLLPHDQRVTGRSEEQTYELQSLMRISYAVFCLKKKKDTEDV